MLTPAHWHHTKPLLAQDLDPDTLQLEHPKQLNGQTAPTAARTTNTNHAISAISVPGAFQSKRTAALGGWKTLGG